MGLSEQGDGLHHRTMHCHKGRGKNGQGEGATPHVFTGCGAPPTKKGAVSPVQTRRQCGTLHDRTSEWNSVGS